MSPAGFLRPCAAPGCAQLVDRGRCDKHKRAPSSRRGYGAQWRKLRRWHLAGEPLCVMCKDNGIATQAEIVDHIRPISFGGDPLAVDNLQSLCRKCHGKKTARDMACEPAPIGRAGR